MVYQTTETKHHVTLKGPEIIDDLDDTWDDASTHQVSKYLNIHCYIFYGRKCNKHSVRIVCRNSNRCISIKCVILL